MVIWYIFSRLGILYQEKSGNPATIFHFLSFRVFLSGQEFAENRVMGSIPALLLSA
jgi:hypothetical protein